VEFEMRQYLMKHAIETPAEMSAVAGRTLKSFSGKGERAKCVSRRTRALAACLGLLLLGQNAHAGFAEELLSYMGIQVVENIAGDALTGVNNVDGGYVTGRLLSILGQSTDGQLAAISDHIAATQDMIGNLQASLDAFEVNVNQDFQLVEKMEANSDYNDQMQAVKTSAIMWPI
jgi:hypothetical protein